MRWYPICLVAAVLVTGLAVAATHPTGDATLHYPQRDVDAAFARGAPLFENGEYKIHASRRSEAGQAEIHVRDTDLIYVREGRATFVTGGSVVDPVETAPDEIRGASIQGGTAREIGPGDVLIVPNGTPHWFRAVRGPVLYYYVVKVTAEDRG